MIGWLGKSIDEEFVETEDGLVIYPFGRFGRGRLVDERQKARVSFVLRISPMVSGIAATCAAALTFSLLNARGPRRFAEDPFAEFLPIAGVFVGVALLTGVLARLLMFMNSTPATLPPPARTKENFLVSAVRKGLITIWQAKFVAWGNVILGPLAIVFLGSRAVISVASGNFSQALILAAVVPMFALITIAFWRGLSALKKMRDDE